MYHFVQFCPSKRESWKIIDETQLGSLSKPVAFQTILSVDQDPEVLAEADEDPTSHVKYYGPMYWDFDGPDIDVVLEDVRTLLLWLEDDLGIHRQFIHCWLSGSKGVHITIPPQVFGVDRPVKLLPWIWKEIALTKELATLDLGVYSTGRGRMWRCEGVKRPDKGTYKVGVSPEELFHMDSDQYAVLIASPRPPLSKEEPPKNVVFPVAQTLTKTAKTLASKKYRALQSVEVVPDEVLTAIEGVPGCIHKLITEGDCFESNWNQAAMQLSAYIAARYTRDDEDIYTTELIDPFVANVSSSSRASETERRKHVKAQLARAFGGRTKFSVGPLIATLGAPCGACPLCRADLRSDSPHTLEGGDSYCEVTKIRARPDGYFLVGENSMRRLTTFTFKADTEISLLEETDEGYRETRRVALMGDLTDDAGQIIHDFEMPEKAWAGRRELRSAIEGRGTSTVECSDAEAQKLLRAVLSMNGTDMRKITKTNVCGIVLERVGKGNTIPHYVEATGSYTQHNTESRFYFEGEKSSSPNLFEEDYPGDDDEDLERALRALMKCNTPTVIAASLGWTVACHFREHIQAETNQFPLLNLNGGAEAGKTSLICLMLCLGGIDYHQSDFINAEVTTMYPLVRFVTSSTTVPRLLEEVNPAQIPARLYGQILGILKASWNRAAIPRGYVSAGSNVRVTKDRVSSPIVFLSEQPPTVPSLRSRAVEVRLASKTLREASGKEYKEAYKVAMRNRHVFGRIAKALVTKALNTPPSRVMEIIDSFEDDIPSELGQRPKFGYQVVFAGLQLLAETCERYEVDVVDEIRSLSQDLKEALVSSKDVMSAEKSVTEVDKIFMSLDCMAEEPENPLSGLKPGTHYWRNGDYLYLVMNSVMPRYLRFARSTGDQVIIRDANTFNSLLQGEIYFERFEDHPSIPKVRVSVINLRKLATKGTALSQFIDETEPNE